MSVTSAAGPSVVTLGCRLNIAESETIRRVLGERDVAVVNSCAVTAEAVSATRRAIRRLRRERPDAELVVTGCAAQIDPHGLLAMPEVDRVIGNAAKLDPAAWSSPEPLVVRDFARVADTAPQLLPGFAGHSRAFLEIQNGCDHRCTFCTIPAGRGPNRGSDPAGVIAQARELVAGGHAELVLTGVDLTSYPHGVAALVEALLAEVAGLARLRLSSLDPAAIDDRLFALLVEEERVMPHVHLSIQAGDDMVLKRMRRRHSRSDTVALVGRLKRARPDIAIGADLIAGFPTEDETMAANSLALIEECDIVHAHVFPYSPRPGTPAARMPQVPPALVRQRAAALRAAGAARRAAWLARQVGATLPVLVERPGTRGHSPHFAEVRFGPEQPTGAIVPITITAADGERLHGTAA